MGSNIGLHACNVSGQNKTCGQNHVSLTFFCLRCYFREYKYKLWLGGRFQVQWPSFSFDWITGTFTACHGDNSLSMFLGMPYKTITGIWICNFRSRKTMTLMSVICFMCSHDWHRNTELATMAFQKLRCRSRFRETYFSICPLPNNCEKPNGILY